MHATILANALDATWLPSFENISVLSLDCFDTLLWRKVAAPTDVFFVLAQTEEFRRHGLTANLRAKAESQARKRKSVVSGVSEVNLREIYRTALKTATDEEIAALASREIEVEKKVCFGFAPVVALVHQAKQLGKKVIIVSDTYLCEEELTDLVYSVVPSLEGMIDSFYCSNEFGLSKSAGIWRKLLPAIPVRPECILHLGDNEQADIKGAVPFGIRTAHLQQYITTVSETRYARAQIASQMFPEIRDDAPLPDHYHGLLAQKKFDKNLNFEFGYVSLGPIMQAFAQFINDEVDALESGKGRVKVAFLLRDGFLPSKACAALQGRQVGSLLNISRFTAIAATLIDKDSIVAYLATSLTIDSMPFVAKQLLLEEDMRNSLLKRAGKDRHPVTAFIKLLLEEHVLNAIYKSSRRFRANLLKHVQKVTGVAPGDTLVFVDLGYSGTAQNLLSPVLKRELNIDLVGRYLIAAEVNVPLNDRKGLIDAAQVDNRIINALTGGYIAGFEMLCTQNAPSTIGYTDDGDPVFGTLHISQTQQDAVQKIQDACIEFIHDHRASPLESLPSQNAGERMHSAAIDLGRLAYFPTTTDINCLNAFQFDFNLGTDKNMSLFDLDQGLKSMRTQGFDYMSAGFNDFRTSYPVELRFMDVSLSTLLFAQNRFGFPVRPSTASYRTEIVTLLALKNDQHTITDVEATATYDGYFSLLAPLSADLDIAILFGKTYDWIQIDSIESVRLGNGSDTTELVPGDDVIFEGIDHEMNGLMALGPDGMIVLKKLQTRQGRMCRVIYRPISYRST